jgi:hypothetical protein
MSATCERVSYDTPTFPLGMVVTTPGILDAVPYGVLPTLLRRHASGDWGSMDPSDWKANDAALKHGDRLLSSYDVNGTTVWVITEYDRSVTTVLLPEEY